MVVVRPVDPSLRCGQLGTVARRTTKTLHAPRPAASTPWTRSISDAGYVYDHSPVKTEYVDPLLPDANRNGVSLGLGYDITSHLSVDAAYFYLKFDQRVAVNTIRRPVSTGHTRVTPILPALILATGLTNSSHT